jgi:hypothetical protein
MDLKKYLTPLDLQLNFKIMFDLIFTLERKVVIMCTTVLREPQ